jgi:hypothetical protein
MRQIVYVSLSTVKGDKADLAGILEQSRHDNAIDGITGLLWSDGRSFLQAFEGPRASIDATFARIVADDRHHTMTVVSDRRIVTHEFGEWSMVHRRENDPPDIYDARIRRLLSEASDGVRNQFQRLIAVDKIPIPISRQS